MKLISISENTKQNIKEAFKAHKDNFVFALALVIVMNICSGYTLKKSEKAMTDAEQLLEEIKKEEEEEKEERMSLEKNDNDKNEKFIKKDILNAVANVDDKTLEMLAKSLNQYYKIADGNLSKAKLLAEIVDEAVKETTNDDIIIVDDISSENEDEEITIDNFDTASLEEKMKFICDKYNLTDFELKVIISVVFHEAGWHYDDAFKVATVIYNRTKSKKTVSYIHNLTKLDGESLYSQVIATSYTKDGKKVQQFDGYLPNIAGYDFDSLLAESQAARDYDLVKLNGLLDCLILLKLGEDYENAVFPLAPCFSKMYFYGDGIRNHFSGPIAASDVVDNYKFPDEEYSGEFTREDVINIAKEYVISAKKRVK